MTTQEFSLEFDSLYNSIMSDVAPGLNGYEKSVFLTTAQEQTVISMLTGGIGTAYERDELTRQTLEPLLREAVVSAGDGVDYGGGAKLYTVTVPDGVWYRVYESATAKVEDGMCGGGTKSLDVLPVPYDELRRTLRNPFRTCGDRRALRVDREGTASELLSKLPLTEYRLRYIVRPHPIILSELTDGLTINGVTDEATCQLGEICHRQVLTLAVQLAKTAWTASQNNTNAS